MSAVTSRPRIRSVVLPVAHPTASVACPTPEVSWSPDPALRLPFADALVSACVRASSASGFPSATVERVSAERVRVIASHPGGQALISEVDLPLRGEPSVTSELLGLHDQTCEGILDRFDRAMEDQGIRSAPPTRRLTGGVCLMEGARAFAERLVPNRLQRPDTREQRTRRAPHPRLRHRRDG